MLIEIKMKCNITVNFLPLKMTNVYLVFISSSLNQILRGVITVKNKCLIMISTISVMTLRYTNVLFQCDVLICYLVLVL